jgi:hypothetical protein
MMDHFVPTPNVDSPSTAEFQAYNVPGTPSVVIVAKSSWLDPGDGWTAGEHAVIKRPDETLASLDANSLYRCYSELHPDTCDILNVITCPPKPGATQVRAQIIAAWHGNRAVRLQWRTDNASEELVFGQVSIQGEGISRRL